MSEPNGKGTALITGASSGIGKVYADRMARRGYDLILVARDEQRLNDLSGQLKTQTGIAVDVLKGDLTNKAGLTRIEERLRTDKTVTMLINNAGISVSGPFNGSDLDQQERLIQLNIAR